MPYTHVTIKIDKAQAVCAGCGAATALCDTEDTAARWAINHRWKIEKFDQTDYIRCPDCAVKNAKLIEHVA